MLNCIIVGLGGLIGSVLRYLIGLIKLKESAFFPYKTLIINIIGAFVIGMIAAYVLKNPDVDPKIVLFIRVGICGGFTTFSTFALESYNLIQTERIVAAIIYIVLSVTLSILAVVAARLIIK